MDRRFNEVVTNGSSTGYGERERGYRALCGDCGSYHTCKRKEFGEERDRPFSDTTFFYAPYNIGMEHFKYVAQMRAWNCCSEGEEPHDEFPEMPDDLDKFVKR